jgi:hypothetical protein
VHDEHDIRREPRARTRLLAGHAPLDASAALGLAAHLIAAGQAGDAGSRPA